MVKKDFVTFEEYKKALETPKKEEPKLIEIKPKVEKQAVEDEPMVMDDAYEAYKLEWMIENGYTIYDIVEAVVDYAITNNKIKDLQENPSEVVVKWEDKAGFGTAAYTQFADYEMWDDYDAWLAGVEDDVSGSDKLDELTEIVDLLDNGYAADEIEDLGYKPGEVELAMQYSNFALSR